MSDLKPPLPPEILTARRARDFKPETQVVPLVDVQEYGRQCMRVAYEYIAKQIRESVER
jgi:hypothetical protein